MADVACHITGLGLGSVGAGFILQLWATGAIELFKFMQSDVEIYVSMLSFHKAVWEYFYRMWIDVHYDIVSFVELSEAVFYMGRDAHRVNMDASANTFP